MVRLKTLGELKLIATTFQRPKPLLLLVYLALEGAKDRRHIAQLFWSDAANPASSLRVALTQLRQGVENAVLEDGQKLAFALTSDVQNLLESVRNRDFQNVAALYSGAFLEGFVLPDWSSELEEWVYATRESIAAQVRGALLYEAEQLAASQNYGLAATRAEAAYKVQGAKSAEPEELERLYAVLLAGDSVLAAQVRREAREFNLELNLTPLEARARFVVVKQKATRFAMRPIPSAKTSFVGRDPELIELANLLAGSEVRLVTILGAGGVGKTRLALQLAHDQRQENQFENGLHFVPLETLNSNAQIPRAILDALGVAVFGSADPLEVLQTSIADHRILLVLDNFEHLTDGALMISKLLERCPNLMLLVTSRERLNLEEEFVLPLSGFRVSSDQVNLADAEAFDAVRLFIQRAKRARIDFDLTQSDLPSVLKICRLVDGMPLGIELAAAWVKVMSVAQLALELTQNFDLLESNSRNITERHRNLRAVFEYSWNLLTVKEQFALASLSVFQGGFDHKAASAVTGVTIAVLTSLVDKSLLRVNADGRYDRHALIHQHAYQKLETMPEVRQMTQIQHAQFFLALAQTAASELYGISKALWLSRLGLDHQNFHVALEWAYHNGNCEIGLQLAGALKNYWMIRGHLVEGSEWLEGLLKLEVTSTQRVPLAVRATALTGAAWLAHARDDFALATSFFQESASLRREMGETAGLEAALVNEAMLARSEGDYARATSLLEQSLSRQREAGNHQSIGQDGLGLSLSRLALVLCEQGQYARAESLLEESLRLHQELGDRGGMAATLLGQSDIAREQAHATRCQALAQESIVLFEDLGEAWGVAFALNNLALAAYVQGDLEHAQALSLESVAKARTLWGGAPSAESLSSLALIALARHDLEQARSALTESLTATRQYGPRWLIAQGIEGFAALALQEFEPQKAIWLLGASEALRSLIGLPLSPLRRPIHERLVRETQQALTMDKWISSHESGRAAPLEQVIAFALNHKGSPQALEQFVALRIKAG